MGDRVEDFTFVALITGTESLQESKNSLLDKTTKPSKFTVYVLRVNAKRINTEFQKEWILKRRYSEFLHLFDKVSYNL